MGANTYTVPIIGPIKDGMLLYLLSIGFMLSSTVTAGNRLLCMINQTTPPNMSVRFSSSFDGDIAEVYIASEGWLRVCHNNDFDYQDADVLCKQVGYSAALNTIPLVLK